MLFRTAVAADLPLYTALASLTSGLQAPERVALGLQSQLYVSDPQAGQIAVFDAFGRLVLVRQGMGRPLGIAMDNQGRMLVGDAATGSVNIFDSQWTVVGHLGQGPGEFQLPGYIAQATIAGVNTVFVSDGPANVVKAYRQGALWAKYGGFGAGLNQFDFPAGLWVSPDGLLFVVDQNNDRVQVLDARTGEFLRRFSLQPPPVQLIPSGRSQGITGDAQGHVFVADTFQGYIKVFDTSGLFLGHIGGYGENSGQLRSPCGLALDFFGRLCAASAVNGRVEVFGLDCFTQLGVSPLAQAVPAGATVTFTAATGCGVATNQWLKNQSALNDGGNVSGSASPALTLAAVTAADSGSYSVLVFGADWGFSTPAATLQVVASSPIIVSGPTSRTASQGATTSFSVSAQGSNLQYQWLQDGVALPGATLNSLTLSNVQPWSAGKYSVKVTNPAGTVTSGAATLTVTLYPVITEPPVDQIAAVGSSVTFSVVAVGSPTLSYQWSRNGVALGGQTRSQLVLAGVTAAVNGNYSVRVSNPAGSATASARFAVNAPVSLSASRNSAGDLVLAWNDPFYVLQAAPTVKGPWQTISSASPFTVPLSAINTNSAQYFRLLK